MLLHCEADRVHHELPTGTVTLRVGPGANVVAAESQAHPDNEEYDGGAAIIEAEAHILSCNRIAEEGLKIRYFHGIVIDRRQASLDSNTMSDHNQTRILAIRYPQMMVQEIL